MEMHELRSIQLLWLYESENDDRSAILTTVWWRSTGVLPIAFLSIDQILQLHMRPKPSFFILRSWWVSTTLLITQRSGWKLHYGDGGIWFTQKDLTNSKWLLFHGHREIVESYPKAIDVSIAQCYRELVHLSRCITEGICECNDPSSPEASHIERAMPRHSTKFVRIEEEIKTFPSQ